MIEQYVSHDELKRLLSSLVVFVGGILIVALFAFIVVPGIRNANKPAAAPSITPPQGETGWLDLTEYPPSKGAVLPAIDPKEVLTATPAMLDRGKVLYAQNCTACHGVQGRGDGSGGAGIRPPPRDFTSPDGWKNGSRLTGIYQTLQNGVKGTSMAAFDTLPKRDSMALAHYVQSFGNFPHADDPKEIEEFGKQFAAAAEVVPPRIPVSMAMVKLEGEFQSPPPLGVARASDLLRGAVEDPERAALTLREDTSWRESPEALARAVVGGAPFNGFSTSAATLPLQQWKELYSELLGAVPEPERK